MTTPTAIRPWSRPNALFCEQKLSRLYWLPLLALTYLLLDCRSCVRRLNSSICRVVYADGLCWFLLLFLVILELLPFSDEQRL
jgi:hypothetical protein